MQEEGAEDVEDEEDEKEESVVSDEGGTPAPRKRGRKPKYPPGTPRGKPGRKPKLPTLKIKFSKRKRTSSVSTYTLHNTAYTYNV